MEKCFKQGRKGVYRCHSQQNTISIIILGPFCTWYKSRWFFTSLFQLLPIMGFVTPPLSKSHVLVMVSNASRTPMCENTGGIDLAMYREVRGISIPWIHSSFFAFVRGGVWHAITKSLLAFLFMMLPLYFVCRVNIYLNWIWQPDMATGYGNTKCLHCASSMGKLHTGIPGLLPTRRVGFIIHPYKVVSRWLGQWFIG